MLSRMKTQHRREGTSADYGFILGGRFHGVHVDFDGYPAKAASDLADEASSISSSPDGNAAWDRIAAQVASQTYVAESDVSDILQAQSGNYKPPIPDHPDGAHGDTTLNLLFLVPRKPMADFSKYLAGLDMNAAPIANAMSNRVISNPSWTELASMPTVTKTTRPFNGSPSAWVVTADLDSKQFVVWDSRGGVTPSSPFGKPYATVGLTDAPSLQRLHTTLRESIGQVEPPRLPSEFRRTPAAAGKSIKDGAWGRPPGFAPLPGDPNAPLGGRRLSNVNKPESSSERQPRRPAGQAGGGQFARKTAADQVGD